MSSSNSSQVSHPEFGIGSVEADLGELVLVRFSSGIQKVRASDLIALKSVVSAIASDSYDHPLRTLSRIQAEAIRSVNSRWGVFSRSRIQLLPHQLWVCRKALEKWPARLMIADDVGLGKTIEAGLILMGLKARGLATRVLIVAPASLTSQWQERLRNLFDLRFTLYAREVDTARSDYWNSHDQVIASFQTLRVQNDSQKRLVSADPWDVVIVDEAHHMGADEERGPTLGYKLIDQLNNNNRLRSLLFFTGTPHKGKAYGFFSLMHLVSPTEFDPRQPHRKQYDELSSYLIRNNKQNVTDLRGEKLFKKPKVTAATYSYSAEESGFYQQLTDFISSGEAYANTLGERDARAVMLVLITMQKLASSSIQAVKRAIEGRLAKLEVIQKEIDAGRRRLSDAEVLDEYEAQIESEDFDRLAELEEEIAEKEMTLLLMKDEEPRLRLLVSAAERVERETKMIRLMELLDDDLQGRPVLFFTEYKATQALLCSELMHRYGKESVGFINGDDLLQKVKLPDGRVKNLRMKREEAAAQFNDGTLRYLISTEAGGEGIDLQEKCWTLIHVDLPWNPMRMHQRVGRLNRFGQKRTVEVISLRNPATVEDRIWEKLNSKIHSIMQAFGAAMEEPDDLFQLVLGSAPINLIEEMHDRARNMSGEAFDQWFDTQTSRFGGQDSVDLVKEMLGRADRFDFQQTSTQIPKVDLPDLEPFFISLLQLSNRRAKQEADGLRFETPEAWQREIGIDREYYGLHFDRGRLQRKDSLRLIGSGHRLFDIALDEALNMTDSVTVVRKLSHPLIILKVTEGLSQAGKGQAAVIVGIRLNSEEDYEVLRDWELLLECNKIIELAGRPQSIPDSDTTLDIDAIIESNKVSVSEIAAEGTDLFQHPEIEVIGALLPSTQ